MKILIANIPTQITLPNGKERYFVKAGSRWPHFFTKKRKDAPGYLPFPFYLAYTSAILKNNNFEVYTLDGVALNYSEEDFFRKFKHLHPDVILCESQTPTIEKDLIILKRLKNINPNLRIILSGPHPTVFAKQILKDFSFVDVILLREYEFSCLEVIKSNFDLKQLTKIKGIAFRNKSNVTLNPPEIIDVNKLPFPDREGFPSYEKPNPTIYTDFEKLKPAIQMHASRGCPFRCNFCLWNQVMYCNKPYRPINPKKVVDEMEHCIKKYKVKEIYFDDDTFTGNKRHVLEICNEIRKRRLKVKWSCMGDAMITDTEMIEAMYRAGCIGIKFGIESSNKKLLEEIGKPLNFDKVNSFLKECSKRLIRTHGTITFGIMGETKETMLKTLEYAKKINVDSIQFSITIPFPGTRYFDKMDNEGKILSKNWQDYDGTSKSVVDFGELSNEEVANFCSKAYDEWINHKRKDPRWLKRQIYFELRSSFNQGIGYFLRKSKNFMSSFL